MVNKIFDFFFNIGEYFSIIIVIGIFIFSALETKLKKKQQRNQHQKTNRQPKPSISKQQFAQSQSLQNSFTSKKEIPQISTNEQDLKNEVLITERAVHHPSKKRRKRKMHQAIITKEILDKPVSMRRM